MNDSSPPKKEGALRHAPPGKTYCGSNVARPAGAGQLFPPNPLRLDALGIRYQHRPVDHVLVLTCICDGKLVMDDREKYFHCFGNLECRARHLNFEELLSALVGEAGRT